MISTPARERVLDAARDRRARSGCLSDVQGYDGTEEAWAQAQVWGCMVLDTR